LHAQRGEARTAALEPVVRATVELQEFPFAWWSAPDADDERERGVARRAKTFLAKKTTKAFPGQGRSLRLHRRFFAKMVSREAGITWCEPGATQPDGCARVVDGWLGPAAVGVRQRRLPGFAQAFIQALYLAHAQT